MLLPCSTCLLSLPDHPSRLLDNFWWATSFISRTSSYMWHASKLIIKDSYFHLNIDHLYFSLRASFSNCARLRTLHNCAESSSSPLELCTETFTSNRSICPTQPHPAKNSAHSPMTSSSRLQHCLTSLEERVKKTERLYWSALETVDWQNSTTCWRVLSLTRWPGTHKASVNMPSMPWDVCLSRWRER